MDDQWINGLLIIQIKRSMNENDQQAIQTPAQETSVEPRASSEGVTQATDQSNELQQPQGNSTSAQAQTDTINNSQEVEQKQTRRDRRINKLIEKLKGKDSTSQPAPDINQVLGLQPNAPIITDADVDEYGGIPKDVLNRRLEEKLLQERQLIKQELAAETSYKETVRDHLSDAEKTLELLKDDEVLDEIVAEQYDLINYSIDPYTGQKVFTPRVRMSDIYAKQKRLLDSKITKAQADVTGRLHSQSQESAVAPSATGESSRDYQSEQIYQEAVESGSEEKWAEVIKRRLSGK